jgi:hypothetical protein
MKMHRLVCVQRLTAFFLEHVTREKKPAPNICSFLTFSPSFHSLAYFLSLSRPFNFSSSSASFLFFLPLSFSLPSPHRSSASPQLPLKRLADATG